MCLGLVVERAAGHDDLVRVTGSGLGVGLGLGLGLGFGLWFGFGCGLGLGLDMVTPSTLGAVGSGVTQAASE